MMKAPKTFSFPMRGPELLRILRECICCMQEKKILFVSVYRDMEHGVFP